MITVIIPFEGDTVGLATLLVSLQPQLHPDDDIYIVDSSKDKKAIEIARKYGSNRCFIFVEQTDLRDIDAVQLGFQSMKDNKQQGALMLDTCCVISNTFIANLKKAIKSEFDLLIPRIVKTTGRLMDSNFTWFCAPTTKVIPGNIGVDEFHSCIYMRGDKIDNETLTLELESANNIGVFDNETVMVFT